MTWDMVEDMGWVEDLEVKEVAMETRVDLAEDSVEQVAMFSRDLVGVMVRIKALAVWEVDQGLGVMVMGKDLVVGMVLSKAVWMGSVATPEVLVEDR